MKGLILMTDNSCNKFRYRILNDSTFVLTKEILLKTIMAVHRFGICSSVWCRAWSGCIRIWLSALFAYIWVLPNRNDLMTFETSIDKINMPIHAVYVSGQSDLGLRISPTVSHRCQQAVWILRFKTAEILISLCFSHLNPVHFTFEERDFGVSVVAQIRRNMR